ncbi:MAG TPA: hypothetical protein VGL81_09115 [Polyangiaceae bacterium]|jgi:hypothetical protein
MNENESEEKLVQRVEPGENGRRPRYVPPRGVGRMDAVRLRDEIEEDARRTGKTVAEIWSARMALRGQPNEIVSAAQIDRHFPKKGPAALPVYEVADPTALDPVHPWRFHLWTVGAPVLTVTNGEASTELKPIDAGVPVDGHLSLIDYERIVEQHGTEDTAGESSPEWLADGRAAMLDMDRARPSSALAGFRGELEAWRRQQEAVGRGFALPPEEIAKVTGRPYTPRKSLVPAGIYAKRLAAEKVEREARAVELAAQAEAARIEAARPRTLAERNAWGFEVRLGGIHEPPAQLGSVPFSYALKESRFVLVEAIPGLTLPVLDLQSFRVMRADELIPGNARPPARPYASVYELACRLVEIDRGTADSGPVGTFFTALEPDDHALLDDAARWARGCTPGDRWRRVHSVELLCRGRMLRPDLVAREVWRRIEHRHEAEAATWEQPVNERGGEGASTPGARLVPLGSKSRWVTTERRAPGPVLTESHGGMVWERDAMELACVTAAQRGVVVPGALRSNTLESTLANGHSHRRTPKRK